MLMCGGSKSVEQKKFQNADRLRILATARIEETRKFKKYIGHIEGYGKPPCGYQRIFGKRNKVAVFNSVSLNLRAAAGNFARRRIPFIKPLAKSRV